MKTEFRTRAVSFIASLTLALVATLGVALSLTSSGDHVWTQASLKSSASIAAKPDVKSVEKPGKHVMSALTAPVATTLRQVM